MRFSPTNELDDIYLASSLPEIQISRINVVCECVQTVLLKATLFTQIPTLLKSSSFRVSCNKGSHRSSLL